MIKRWLIVLLLLQCGAAIALALLCGHWWRPDWLASLNPPVTALLYLALGWLGVLLIRAALCLQSFWFSSLAGSATPPAHALTPVRALRLFVDEFTASLQASCYTMVRPFGMRLAAQPRGLPVLLLHGYACNSGYWRPLSAALTRAGVSHYAIDLEPPGASIDAYAPQVQAAVERLCAASGSTQVIVLGHSMGGLVARAWLRRYGTAAMASVAKVITLGTPHHGTVLARLAPGQNAAQMRYASAWLAELAASDAILQRTLFSSIYSAHDNIVAPQDSGALPGARNQLFGAIGHVALGRHRAIMQYVLAEIAAASLL